MSPSTQTGIGHGEGSCDGPLIVDPTQSGVFLSLNGRGIPFDEGAILVVRTTALIGCILQRSSADVYSGTSGREM